MHAVASRGAIWYVAAMTVPFIRPGGVVDERVRDDASACGVPPETIIAAAMDAFHSLADDDQVELVEAAMRRWFVEAPAAKTAKTASPD